MANVLKSLLDALKLTDEEDDDDFDEYEEKERERRQPRRRSTYEELPEPRREVREKKPAVSFATSKQVEPRRSTVIVEDKEDDEIAFTDSKKERFQRSSSSNSIVPLRSRSASSSSLPISEICIMKPTSFEDSQDVCDMLIQGRAAVINLEGLELTLSQRIMDFISGSVYSLNGKLHQVSGYIFIISPESFDISGDYLNFIEQSGFEVPNLK